MHNPKTIPLFGYASEDRWMPTMLSLTAELPVVCDVASEMAWAIERGEEPRGAHIARVVAFCEAVEGLPGERVSLHWANVVKMLRSFGVVADFLDERGAA